MSLHPALRDYLDRLNPLVARAARDGVVTTPASARAALAGLNQYALPRLPVARITDTTVDTDTDTDTDAGPVPVRIYASRPDAACDTLLFVHGGGHLAGDLDVYDFSARRIAVATGMVVVSVDYRR